MTDNGEVATNIQYEIDNDIFVSEEKYNGLYGITTNLMNDTKTIIKVMNGRWEIEESFRIMKTDFEARPVYVRREDRIKAHFLICYMALLLFRLMEKKLNSSYTASKIIDTLREYRLLKIDGFGYLPEYTRTDLTDKLHEVFKFRTDAEIVPTSLMRKIVANTKK